MAATDAAVSTPSLIDDKLTGRRRITSESSVCVCVCILCVCVRVRVFHLPPDSWWCVPLGCEGLTDGLDENALCCVLKRGESSHKWDQVWSAGGSGGWGWRREECVTWQMWHWFTENYFSEFSVHPHRDYSSVSPKSDKVRALAAHTQKKNGLNHTGKL